MSQLELGASVAQFDPVGTPYEVGFKLVNWQLDGNRFEAVSQFDLEGWGVMSDPGPAPWDVPEAPPKVAKRRGTAKAKAPSAYRWRPDPTAQQGVGLEDCPHCGYLTLYAPRAGVFSDVRVDIWQIPYADASIIDRYHIDVLWMVFGKYMKEITPWHPIVEGRPALLRHQCGNKWWLYGPYRMKESK